MDLVCIVGRDRQALAATSLVSISQARQQHSGETRLVFLRDPLTVEYDAEWLEDRGVDVVIHPDVPADLPARQRVARMRCAGMLFAIETGADRIVHLDSDIAIDPDFFGVLDELWTGAERRTSFGAATLGNFAGYAQPGFLLEQHPGFSIRTHGLGGCLIFSCDSRTLVAARAGVPAHYSWDNWMSSKATGAGRVLTSDVSYVRHLGRGEHAGMCGSTAFPDLDWSNFSEAIR